MSRSYKKAIRKDRGIKHLYHRTVRHITNQIVRNFVRNNPQLDEYGREDLELPDAKSVIDDYDYCDYIIDYEHIRNSSYDDIYRKKKWRRK